MEYHSLVCSNCSYYQFLIGYRDLIGEELFSFLLHVCHRRNVSSQSIFYEFCGMYLDDLHTRFKFKFASPDLVNLIHTFLSHKRLRSHRKFHLNSPFPRTGKMWDKHPCEYFSIIYNFRLFKIKINKYLIDPCTFESLLGHPCIHIPIIIHFSLINILSINLRLITVSSYPLAGLFWSICLTAHQILMVT